MEPDLKTFIENIQNSNKDFTMQIDYGDPDDIRTYHFLQSVTGDTKLVYGMESENLKWCFTMGRAMELVAVKTKDGSIYFNDYNGTVGTTLCYYGGASLRELMYKVEREVGNLFKELADATPYFPTEEQVATTKKKAYTFARMLRQEGNQTSAYNPKELMPVDISPEEMLYIICGNETPKQYVDKYVEKFPLKISNFQEDRAFCEALNGYLKKGKSDLERD